MRILFFSLLVFPFTATAEVYKSVDADGNVIYSDRLIENSVPVDIARDADSSSPQPDTPGDLTQGGFPGPYHAFEIANPQNNATVQNEQREIQLSLLLDPALQDNHRLNVEVNGVKIEGDLGKDTQMRLNGIPLGSHRIQVVVEDENGAVVAATPVINIHVRRPLPDGSPPESGPN
ncbi:MAG TPA: DUF4124 domain-containing protein [Chromatiaceae bacterium]|jgi:hypothetical protein|nr:MAG: hypothetical protein N838_14035 [Thiohalocapsa sp. PB-PSB1]QQO53559.1 MAG: DUF4124 domain-containing protein [Thiohalocapsa sp. PB-PSB1]HBG96811.1 DUF4124 domain-containing protein [Chromatiaceae bacterium]HCS88583.1 DUF4124 domain-containing protein [Chromatiaceae bacterium]